MKQSEEAVLRLYHTTCKAYVPRIKLTGLGMDHHDYYHLYFRVKDFFNVPDEHLSVVPVPQTVNNTYFYTTLEQALGHPVESMTQRFEFVEALVKRVALFLGRPYTEFQEVTQNILNASTERVVLVVDVPAHCVISPPQIGTNVVHRITQKLSFNCVREIIPLG